jgi:hypothetical protein
VAIKIIFHPPPLSLSLSLTTLSHTTILYIYIYLTDTERKIVLLTAYHNKAGRIFTQSMFKYMKFIAWVCKTAHINSKAIKCGHPSNDLKQLQWIQKSSDV